MNIKELEHEVIRRGNKIRRFNKPNLYVICGAQHIDKRAIKTNRHFNTKKEYEREFDKTLYERLRTIGPVGGKRPKNKRNGCDYVIGNCAEVHAANSVLKHGPRKTNIDDIFFTKAYRIKTLTPIPYCLNCQEAFNLKN